MLSINMRVFKTVLLIIALFFDRMECLPLENLTEIEEPSTTKEPRPNSEEDFYDQRQDGANNYRVRVDGIAIVFAPLEALLLANKLPTIDKPISEQLKPTTDNPEAEPRPSPATKPTKRGSSKVASLLAPFFQQFQQN